MDWKGYAQPIKDEHEKQGFNGRFGAGLPRVSDGSLLFLQHMLSHMKPVTDTSPLGSRVGIVLSGSPLFSGQAGSGESEIRRWILENDWLEGIVALPDQMFYNTGISTYIWILTNAKTDEERGLVKLIDARDMFTKMRKSLGDKRKELSRPAIDDIVRLFSGALAEYADDKRVKVLPRETFGFQRVTVERPLHRRWEVTEAVIKTPPFEQLAHLAGKKYDTEKALLTDAADLTTAQKKNFAKACAVSDPEAPAILKKGQPEPDPDLRDQENIPLPTGWFDLDDNSRLEPLRNTTKSHLRSQIRLYAPDAWIDHSKTKIGFDFSIGFAALQSTPERTDGNTKRIPLRQVFYNPKTRVPFERMETGTNVIRSSDITRDGHVTPARNSQPNPKTISAIALEAEDLIISSIVNESPVKCALIEPSDLPAAAGNDVIVLRHHPQVSASEVSFYREFFASTRGHRSLSAISQGSSIIRPGKISDITLPNYSEELLESIRTLRAAEDQLLQWTKSAREATSSAFDGEASEAVAELQKRSLLMLQRVEAGRQLEKFDYRIANLFPQPIAQRWLQLSAAESSGDLKETYQAILDCYETTMSFAGCLTLACAHANNIKLGSLETLRSTLSSKKRGVAIGFWVNLQKEFWLLTQEDSLPESAPLREAADFLPSKSDAEEAQERLTDRRNDQFHQRRIDFDKLERAVHDSKQDLVTILRNMKFLEDSNFFQAIDTSWSEYEQENTVKCLQLKGDSSTPRTEFLRTSNPRITTGGVYFTDPRGNLTLLSPFLIRMACPECRQPSLFFPAHAKRSVPHLQALTHSHSTDASANISALRFVGLLP